MLAFRELSKSKSIFEMPLRVVYYARVSTDKDEQLNSLDNQIFYYDELIKNNPNWVFSGAYVDEGITGTSVSKRNSFLRMINDAKRNLFDLIITKEISRFSRNTLDSIQYTQELLSHGVGVYFQSDNINTLMPDSELRLTIMASIAQEEVRKLSERLRFGYQRAIEKKRVLGQNNILGYKKTDCKLVVNEEQARIVRQIFGMYAEGSLGSKRIAKELECQGVMSPFSGRAFSHASITAIIQNPKYKGYYCSGKTASVDYRNNKRIYLPKEQWNVFKDESVPSIVSEELWDKANEILRIRASDMAKGKSTQNRYLYTGKIICADHNSNYNRHVYKSKSKGEQEVWNCRLYRLKGKLNGCDSPTIYSSELDDILDKIYKSLFSDRERVISGLMDLYSKIDAIDYSKEIENVEKEMAAIHSKKEKLLEFSIEGIISKEEFAARNNKFNLELGELGLNLQKFKNEMNKALDKSKGISKLRKILEKEFASAEHTKENVHYINTELTNTFLEKIVVHKMNGSKTNLKLEIVLKIGRSFTCEFQNNDLISVNEIGISQAQVSRLEKSALKNMKKYIS